MSSRYADERYSPKVPACSPAPIRLSFDGHFLNASGVKFAVFSAVSGKASKGKFDYSVKNQKILNAGPIPEGDYWIQPSEIQENAWYRYNNSQAAWGDFWLTIHPHPRTNTYARGGFFIHGGSFPGSSGCIDLSVNIGKFIAFLNATLDKSKNCYIPLTVNYYQK